MARSSARARSLRRRAPLNERRLWELLRGGRLDNLKFRRQMLIGGYVVDFVCLRHRLVVEADGPLHDAERDTLRDRWLRAQGFKVLRFNNSQIEVWPDRVLDQIRRAAGLREVFRGPLEDIGKP